VASQRPRNGGTQATQPHTSGPCPDAHPLQPRRDKLSPPPAPLPSSLCLNTSSSLCRCPGLRVTCREEGAGSISSSVVRPPAPSSATRVALTMYSSVSSSRVASCTVHASHVSQDEGYVCVCCGGGKEGACHATPRTLRKALLTGRELSMPKSTLSNQASRSSGSTSLLGRKEMLDVSSRAAARPALMVDNRTE
jgi:hypothetical protein